MMPLRQVLTPHGGIAMYDREASHALTEQLLAEASDGLDHIAGELANMYRHWLEMGVEARFVDWVAPQIAKLCWWSGRSGARRPDRFGLASAWAVMCVVVGNKDERIETHDWVRN